MSGLAVVEEYQYVIDVPESRSSWTLAIIPTEF